MMADRKDHHGKTSCLIYTMSPLLHTIQMTIDCIVLAKARDEVGDGPMASVLLFAGGWPVWLWMHADGHTMCG